MNKFEIGDYVRTNDELYCDNHEFHRILGVVTGVTDYEKEVQVLIKKAPNAYNNRKYIEKRVFTFRKSWLVKAKNPVAKVYKRTKE